jgi:hypothetical protein
MTLPSLFKLSPNKGNKYDRANILKAVDLGEEDVAQNWFRNLSIWQIEWIKKGQNNCNDTTYIK